MGADFLNGSPIAIARKGCLAAAAPLASEDFDRLLWTVPWPSTIKGLEGWAVTDWSFWSLSLELQLKRKSANEFQSFFNRCMQAVHGDDFVSVRPYGNQGDGGVDAVFGNGDTIYQCYGKEHDGRLSIPYVAGKMAVDFRKALETTPHMRRWRFAHNLDSVPMQILTARDALATEASPLGVDVRLFGYESLRRDMERLSDQRLEELLGRDSIVEIDRARLPGGVTAAIESIMGDMETAQPSPSDIRPVPLEKMQINGISSRWARQLKSVLPYTRVVEECLAGAVDPRAADEVPGYFRHRYLELRAQDLDPGEILHSLLVTLAGRVRTVSDHGGDEAALVLLASMFESCIVFEDKATSALGAAQ